MSFVRKWMAVFLAVSILAAPALRAYAEEGSSEGMERNTASKTSESKKKKKKKKKKKAKGHSAKHRAKKNKSAGKSHYPTTQSAGAGGFSDTPSEKKDDLPAPAAPKE